MYTHVASLFSFSGPDGPLVTIAQLPGKEPGTCTLVTTVNGEVVNTREIVHTAGAADLQIQSGIKWMGEQLFAGILEAELTKNNRNG